MCMYVDIVHRLLCRALSGLADAGQCQMFNKDKFNQNYMKWVHVAYFVWGWW